MSHMSEVVAVLDADTGTGGVAALLTGGIYGFDEAGENGISRSSTPSAYNSTTQAVKPCALVKTRSYVLDGAIVDEKAQHASYRAVVEIWLYDGANSFTTLETVANRIYALLHEKSAGTGVASLVNELYVGRSVALDDALCLRLDYQIVGIRRPL